MATKKTPAAKPAVKTPKPKPATKAAAKPTAPEVQPTPVAPPPPPVPVPVPPQIFPAEAFIPNTTRHEALLRNAFFRVSALRNEVFADGFLDDLVRVALGPDELRVPGGPRAKFTGFASVQPGFKPVSQILGLGTARLLTNAAQQALGPVDPGRSWFLQVDAWVIPPGEELATPVAFGIAENATRGELVAYVNAPALARGVDAAVATAVIHSLAADGRVLRFMDPKVVHVLRQLNLIEGL